MIVETNEQAAEVGRKVRCAAEELASLLTNATRQGVTINFDIGPSPNDPTLVVIKKFDVSRSVPIKL